MTPGNRGPAVGRWIATTLRTGTLVSVAVLAVGYAIVTIGEEEADRAERLGEALASGGGHALIAVGIIALTLVPTVVLAVAAGAFARARETRMLATALGVMGLLLASVAATLLIGGGGI